MNFLVLLFYKLTFIYTAFYFVCQPFFILEFKYEVLAVKAKF